MSEVFLEWIVKAKTTTLGIAARIGGILLVIIAVLSFVILGIYSMIAVFFTGFLLYKIWQWTNIEYEYSFLTGELDIDMIMGQNSRKRVFSISINDTEIIAHEKSDRIAYFNNPDVTVIDYSTGIPSDDKYVIAANLDGKKTKVIFEPNRKMIEAMRELAPNKVFLG